jgi:ribonuclease HI
VPEVRVITDACCHIPEAHKSGRVGRGYCACGVLILDGEDKEIARIGDYLGEMTVPESEYNAIIVGLERASKYCRDVIEVWSDSQLVIKHLNKEWRLGAENLKPLYDRIKQLENRYKEVKYFHHPREVPLAKEADKIADSYYRKYHQKK